MKKKTDSKTNADKTFEDILLDFQTRLQGIANGLAAKLGELIASTDAAILRTLVKELPKREKTIRAETRRIERLIAKIEKMRRPGFDAARDLTFETALEVGDAASSQTVREIETAQQDAAERGGGDFSASKKSGKRPKSLSAKQVKEIVEYEPVDGESIAGWFEGLRRGDLQRITRAVARASVEGLTVSAIASAIRGTKANGYRDGILQTTRDGAAKLARTTINGVCNNARLETIRENEDVVDGAKFVGTLDGRTCPHCGALDGKVWPVKELDAVRRPPIHISCRCCVVPHIDLRTPDGKIVEVGTRPAANADFDALAKESYNKTAREKGLKRRWDDLSPSTRLKYYYQAQKDYERRTGKPAYRQVSPSTTFRDYFERQPAAFQRAWLGKNRYELYRNGAATFDDLTKPASTYRATTGALFQASEPSDEKRVSTPEPEPKRGKRLSDFGPLRSSANAAPITDAKSFIAAIEERRREVFGEAEAEKLNAQEREYALERVKAAALGRAYWRTKQEYQKAIQGSANQEETLNLFNLLRDQKTRFDKRADALKNKNIARYAASERAFWLDALFPDVDGVSLFSVKERQDLASVFAGRQCDAPALEVLELFDKIGRFIGADPTTPKPFAQFSPTLGNKSGAYYDDRLMIFIHPEKSASGADFSATFAHEIGHWFEVRVLGYDVADANVDWLREVTGNENAPQVQKQDGEILDLSGCQEVFWSYNYYSAWVYPLRDSPDGKPYRVSEIASTGLEALLTDPEAFARSAPEHFNRILSIIRAARNK